MRRTPLALLVLAAPLAAQDARTYTLTGESIAIYNLAGAITVVGGGQGAVAVAVHRIGADAGRLTVETGELRGQMTLRVLYPDDQVIYPALGRGSNSSFQIREDGTWGGERWGHGREGRRVTVRGSGRGLEAAADLRVTVPEGRRLAIYLGVGRIEATNVAGTIRLDAMSGDVSAQDLRGTLDIDTGSGDVTVDGATGSVTLDTGSGDVSVSDVREGELEIDSGSGTVTGTRLSVRRLAVDAGSGDVRLDGTSTPHAAIETGSGNIHVTLSGTVERLNAETGSGDVTIRLPDAVDAMVELETGSGDLDLGIPLQLIRKSEGELRGRVGQGRGLIQIETGSGDISLLQ